MHKSYTFYTGLISSAKIHSLFLFFSSLFKYDLIPLEQYIALEDTKNTSSKNMGTWCDNKML